MRNLSQDLISVESYLDKAIHHLSEVSAPKATLTRSQLKVLNEALMKLCLKIFWQKPLTAKFVIFIFWQELGNQVKLSPNAKTLARSSLNRYLKLLKEKHTKGEEPHWTTLKTTSSPKDEKRLRHLEQTRIKLEESIESVKDSIEHDELGVGEKRDLEKMLGDFEQQLKKIKYLITNLKG